MNENETRKLFNGLSIEFNEGLTGNKIVKKGFENIYNFVKKEHETWAKINKRNKIINSYLTYYQNAVGRLDGFKNRDFSSSNDNKFMNAWKDVYTYLTRGHTDQNIQILYSITPYGKFYYNLCETDPDISEAAFEYFTKRPISFIGYIKAYEFEKYGDVDNLERRKSECSAINDKCDELAETAQDSTQKIEDVKIDISQWSTNFIEKHDEWLEEVKVYIEALNKEWIQKFTSLEKTYTEKLKLEGPVQYWKDRVKKYRTTGIISLITLASAIFGSVYFILIPILYDPPKIFNYNLFAGDPLAIKALIIFLTIVSFIAYLVKSLTKLTFSSFHLQRDAEEREQLTMVYLALIKEGNIAKEDLTLVLQSLFSRSETGLIGNEGLPKMPGTAQLLDKL